MGFLNLLWKNLKFFFEAFVVDVYWEEFGYEIKLNNNIEMFFNRNGNFLRSKI